MPSRAPQVLSTAAVAWMLSGAGEAGGCPPMGVNGCNWSNAAEGKVEERVAVAVRVQDTKAFADAKSRRLQARPGRPAAGLETMLPDAVLLRARPRGTEAFDSTAGRRHGDGSRWRSGGSNRAILGPNKQSAPWKVDAQA